MPTLRDNPHQVDPFVVLCYHSMRTMEGLELLRVNILEVFDHDELAFRYATTVYCDILFNQDKSDPKYRRAARFGMMYYMKTRGFIRLHRMDSMIRAYVRTKWAVVRSCVKLLSLHHRAVISANHPDRIDFSV